MKLISTPIDKATCFVDTNPLEGGLVKAVVDIGRGIIALDADMHVDIEQYLLQDGSLQQDLWGINFYPNMTDEDWIEFDSMINIRPRHGNRSRSVEDPYIQEKIRSVIAKLII